MDQGLKKVIVNYCITREAVLINFSEFIHGLKKEKGKKIEGLIRKKLIERGIQVLPWIPLVFIERLPKIEGSITIEIDIRPSWKVLKEKLQELNK